MGATADPILGFTDLEEVDGKTYGTAHRESGVTERTEVRISVEREHRRADGSLVAAGEVASTDDGSVRVGARL